MLNQNTPAKVHSTWALNVDETALLEEANAVLGMLNDMDHILVVVFQLLTDSVIILDNALVRNDDGVSLLLQADELTLELRYAGGVLELEETPLQHVLGRNSLNTEQVEDHVVTEMEGGVELILVADNDSSGRLGLELVIDHHDDDTTVIETTTTSSASHLNVLRGSKRAALLTVPLGDLGEDDGSGRHV